MKITKRASEDRGRSELGWLHGRHTFSFAEYRDSAHMGFRSLRVLNDDIVEPGQGFGTHGHQNAEILTYVIEGRLEHKDSMGNGSIIEPGKLQYMSAGSGVTHSEFNPSRSERVHLLQIWILPDANGGEPRYAEHALPPAADANGLTLAFSGRPREGALAIRADADVYLGRLAPGGASAHATSPTRGVWLHVFEGRLSVGATQLGEGDGAAIEQAASIELSSTGGAAFLLFDLR